MIRGLHGMFYSSDADATREFMRDVLRLPFTDVGGGWLIFDLPEADLGAHPADSSRGGRAGTHAVSFYCDDIKSTVAELKKRGAKFRHDPVDQGYGWVTSFEVPGGIEVQLYEPKYTKAKARKTKGGAKPSAKKATKKRAPAKKAKGRPKPKKSARKR